jgi:hypothetical protein
MAGEALVEPARWMRANLPADVLIATRRIGAAAFVGDKRVFDYSLGLTDRAVARRVRAAGKRFWSPADPGLADFWRDRRPDYLLEDSDVIDAIVAETGGSRDLFRIHGVPYRVVRSFPSASAPRTLFGRRETEIAWTLARPFGNKLATGVHTSVGVDVVQPNRSTGGRNESPRRTARHRGPALLWRRPAGRRQTPPTIRRRSSSSGRP